MTLNINSLNIPIKKQRLPYRTPPKMTARLIKYKGIGSLKVEGWKNI